MKRHTWRAWGSKEEEELEEMRMSGMTVRECAIKLGRTKQSVRMRCQTMKFTRARTNWHTLLMEEHDLHDVALIGGVTYATVKREKYKLRAKGIYCPPATRKVV